MFELARVAVLARLVVGWVVVDAHLLGWLGSRCALTPFRLAIPRMSTIARGRGRWGEQPPAFGVVPALAFGR